MKKLLKISCVTTAICLAAGLNSCLVATGRHFKHMGQDGQCILTQQRKDETLELYRLDDKVYVKGTQVRFREYNPDLVDSIDRSERTYKLSKPGSPRKTVYQELKLTRYSIGEDEKTGKLHYKEEWHAADTPVLSELPKGAKPYFSTVELSSREYPNVKDDKHWRAAIITEELGANLHASYAYPLATICYVGIDAPVILVQGAALLVATPIILYSDFISPFFKSDEKSAE